MNIHTLLLAERDAHTLERIHADLDALTPSDRLMATRGLTKKSMAALWTLCADAETLDSSSFVPSSTDPLVQVIHHGKNSLPVNTLFQKRFCKADDGSDDLYGYNHQSLAWATGPGYYVAHPVDEKAPGALSRYVIDYTRVPSKKAKDWPEILPQTARLGRFVYAGMLDYMRKVSEHVTVGKAVRGGRETENYFVLCRHEPDPT